VAFNNARFERSLILDDANVTGRVNLNGAAFGPDADLSFYAAEMRSFQVGPAQIDTEDGWHRLFYERCAWQGPDRNDVRVERMLRTEPLDDEQLRALCFDFLIDEFIALMEAASA